MDLSQENTASQTRLGLALSGKDVLMESKIHTLAAKRDALHAETETLLGSSIGAQLYFAASAQDSMPRKPIGGFDAQHASHCTVVGRIACGGGHLAIRGDLAFWNREDGAAERGIAQFGHLQSRICTQAGHLDNFGGSEPRVSYNARDH